MFERIFMFINDSSYIILDNERLNLSVNRWTPSQNPFRGNVFKISVYTTPKLLLSNSAFFILASEDIHNLNQSMFFFSMTDLSYLKKDLNSLGFPFSNVNVSIHSRTKKKKKVIILGSGFPYPLHSVKSCASQALPSCSFYVLFSVNDSSISWVNQDRNLAIICGQQRYVKTVLFWGNFQI